MKPNLHKLYWNCLQILETLWIKEKSWNSLFCMFYYLQV